ncbi:MAG: PEGA domain-containing protein, partial [Myxococcota bacterium]
PEWYFLPFYAILRAFTGSFLGIPLGSFAKLLGVIAMFGSIAVLAVAPATPSAARSGSRPVPAGSKPSVDLLAGEDSVGSPTFGVGSGWTTASPQDDPARAMLAEVDRPSGTAGPAPVRPAPPPAPVGPPCLDPELCGDSMLAAWRDPTGTSDILTEEGYEAPLVANSTAVAELFYTPGTDEAVSDLDETSLDSLGTRVVLVTTDVSGVPVQIDGKEVGEAPLVAEVSPGPHTVRLFGGGDVVTEYLLQADTDPDEWCFEARGRQFKYVRCL